MDEGTTIRERMARIRISGEDDPAASDALRWYLTEHRRTDAYYLLYLVWKGLSVAEISAKAKQLKGPGRSKALMRHVAAALLPQAPSQIADDEPV